MFRRNKPDATSADRRLVTDPARPGGKGRPTRSRREAEAAARARAKTPRSRKEAARAQREARTQNNQRLRTAMRTGDERHYLARDKGPVRRFLRDYVDARFSFVELLMPLLVVNILIGFFGSDAAVTIANSILMAALLVVVIELVTLRFRVRRELARRFPGQSTKGSTWYAITRALQIRFLRQPKPQVRIGQRLPDSYR